MLQNLISATVSENIISAGLEKSPMVRGEERGGRLVFQYEPRSTFVSNERPVILVCHPNY